MVMAPRYYAFQAWLDTRIILWQCDWMPRAIHWVFGIRIFQFSIFNHFPISKLPKNLVRRYLDPKNIPKTPSQEVFERLGNEFSYFSGYFFSKNCAPANRNLEDQNLNVSPKSLVETGTLGSMRWASRVLGEFSEYTMPETRMVFLHGTHFWGD